jgi:hypothetical protein
MAPYVQNSLRIHCVMFSWTTVHADFIGEEVKEAMEDSRDHLRRVLKEQSANACLP